ncbi:TPA: hypothetical protein SEV89_000395 [Campylobacter fetus]|nr:hypothetical protein [Campylobacter fetus]
MRIENLTRLVDGELQNNPKISMVSGFCLEADDVKNGFAFIALNATRDDAILAIQNGAYALITDLNLEIYDDEIAIIKVDNLASSVLRLARFIATQKELKFFHLNVVQNAIFSCLSLPKKISLISSNLNEILTKIINAAHNDIFLSKDEILLNRIFEKTAIKDSQNFSLIHSHSIFYTSIMFLDTYYENLNFPSIFASDLAKVMQFFYDYNLNFNIKDFREFNHFRAIFVDRFLNIKPFGASYRAFICENNEELFITEAKFLKSKFENTFICTPINHRLRDMADLCFESLNDLKMMSDFKYALVFSDFHELESSLNETKTERTLFDF